MTASADGTDVPARWFLRLFGGFELSERSGGRVALAGKRDRVLLAALLLSPNCRLPRRKLTNLLWGEAGDETALDNLRVALWGLRKALGDTEHRVVVSDGDDIALDAASFDCDVLAFRRLARETEAEGLAEAAELYTGELLEGLDIDSEEFESWRRAEALRARDQAIDVLHRLMPQWIASGSTERAIQAGHRILALEPLHEAAVRRLMRLYAESGRRGAAKELYESFAETLRAELAAQPETETRAIFAEIARGDITTADLAAPSTMNAVEFANHTATAPVPTPPGRRAVPARAIGFVLAGTLAAALALFFLSPFATSPGVVSEQNSAAVPAPAIAVAVLPFANLSTDPEQLFFSDGITEEITSALAKIPNLQVVARGSAYNFRGPERDLKAIAEALHATHLIDGSVRKDGDRVRITAHVVETQSGLQLWSQSYDRQFVNIFAIQEEIAQAIATALRVPLGLAPGRTLVSNRTIDPEVYQQFLRAKAVWQQRRGPVRGSVGHVETVQLLEPVVARAPGFAPAWALLAEAYQDMPQFPPGGEYAPVETKRRVAEEWLAKAEAASRRAIALDENLPGGYSALATNMSFRGRFLEAEELLAHALALDPFDPEALLAHGNLLGAVGRTAEALAVKQRLTNMEPFVPVYGGGVNDMLWTSGQTDAVIARLKPSGAATDLAHLGAIYATLGRDAEAVDALLEIPEGAYPQGMVEAAVALLRGPADVARARSLRRFGRRLDFVYFRAGAPERSLERFEDDVAAGFFLGNQLLGIWTPVYAPVRGTERFKTLVRNAGLVAYWREKGWPEFCAPAGSDDFTCH